MANVLIVDDSAVARKMVAKMIVALGHTVVGEAADGKQAFVEYTRLQPDVITLDMAMDNGNGEEAITKIITVFPEARIIVISAHPDRNIIIDALERGARHFIPKPVTIEKLAAVLTNVLQQDFDRQKHLELVNSMRKSLGGKPSVASGTSRKTLPARILVVDDSAVARKRLTTIVTELGHTVVGEAGNGAQAFVEYARLKPDVVTMDMTMQGLSGAEATTKIVASYPGARVIVISAMEARQGIIDALERGARHFIVKPVNKEKIALVLQNVMEQEFNLQKHKECIRQLKEADSSINKLDAGTNSFAPYIISVQDGKMVHVEITECLTPTSYQSLVLELEEHLVEEARVLLDFGSTTRMDDELIFKMNELIKIIEGNSCMVRAVSTNKRFVDLVTQAQFKDTPNILTEVLKYLEH